MRGAASGAGAGSGGGEGVDTRQRGTDKFREREEPERGMITTEYVATMARYNAWQNGNVIAVLDGMDEAELLAGRGAFFGSILATLNHVLWGDRTWMARLAGWKAPAGGIPESVDFAPTYAAWRAERVRVDGRLVHWADTLRPAQLRGELGWYSAALGRDVRKPIALCVVHLFNHQTHHRGQVHAMLTAAGRDPGMTDLALAPDGALA
jgi:uncharacterized damage-inducible protein DinB